MSEVYLNKKPSPELEAWLQQSKQTHPELADYLKNRVTMEQAIGYVIAAMNAEGYFDPVDAGGILLTLIEQQFINLTPEEAEAFYLRSIHRSAEEQVTEDML
ncbi:hypothetical protein EHS13_07320 [Paenibacillus psychroresistens]|uniref:Uncharacterized protein n=1 Tax=Paenibacillus psychroresistens TaxID=1778678 RepID=A0A6B8REX7_9BACL|nr:hypothetical protein [Paenibacillus psychroresistens]QGQ94709.1 hypothetical protein EHS13_07320 [Paenibacillus psychroresistens]